MGKQNGVASPGKRHQPRADPLTPLKSPRKTGAASKLDATCSQPHRPEAAAALTAERWRECAAVLRQAACDPGSAAGRLVPLRPSLTRCKEEIVRLLDEAVSSSNGNAALLVLGPPGTGKTLVVERALQEVCARHNGAAAAAAPTTSAAAQPRAPAAAAAAAAAAGDGAPPPPPVSDSVLTVAVVRLNGLLQPDERTAFQEVARQLCRAFGQRFQRSASFDENLLFLRGMLHALHRCLKKVIFVVDEFQQYAKKGKQQMLYYLLDMLQDSKIQAAVLGLSPAHNVAEDLEKRVLSRVGRRRLLITFPAPPPAEEAGAAGPAALPAAPSPGGAAGSSGGGGMDLDGAVQQQDSYERLLYDMLALHGGMAELAGLGERPGGGGGGGGTAGVTAAAAATHNAAVAAALADPSVQACLSKCAALGAPPQHLSLAAEAALVAWGADLGAHAATHGSAGGPPPPLAAAHVAAGLRELTDAPERVMVDAVAGLPVAALVLLVAAHRLARKGQAVCNFEMAWDEYRSMQGQRGAVAFSRAAGEAAWQALPTCGVAHWSDPHLEARGRDLAYAGVALLVGAAELEAGITAHPHCPDAVGLFHRQEI